MELRVITGNWFYLLCESKEVLGNKLQSSPLYRLGDACAFQVQLTRNLGNLPLLAVPQLQKDSHAGHLGSAHHLTQRNHANGPIKQAFQSCSAWRRSTPRTPLGA